jgi:hypothetical protein
MYTIYIYELGSWRRAWRRVGKAEVEVEVDADMVEEKLEEEARRRRGEEEEEEDGEEEEDNSDKIWMWVKMEDLGDHRCWSSLVFTIQLLGYLILTQTHVTTQKMHQLLGCNLMLNLGELW